MSTGVQIVGQKKFLKSIQRLSNAAKSFDPEFRKTAINSNRRLKINTPKGKGEGTTRGAWRGPRKLGPSKYLNSNDIKSDDGKHLIVNILDKGRRAVRPIRKKFLYIPLTQNGRKKLGAPIPPGAKFGVDYVLVKKSKAFKGTKFLQKEIKESSTELTKRLVSKIRTINAR